MKIELEKTKTTRAKDISFGETCMIENVLAMRVSIDCGSIIEDEIMDDFVCCNFFSDYDYDRTDWANDHCSFVDLVNGEFFYIHKETEVMPMPNVKIVGS